MTSGKAEPAFVRVMAKTVPDGDCLRFTGDRTTRGGYGRIRVGKRSKVVHRVVWEHHHGPMPEGMTIDHVLDRGCHFRDCVNIDHLECVTFQENIDRRPLRDRPLCANGHEVNEQTLYITPSGSRACRPCRNTNQKNYMDRKRAESL